jgi:hypothetical protein
MVPRVPEVGPKEAIMNLASGFCRLPSPALNPGAIGLVHREFHEANELDLHDEALTRAQAPRTQPFVLIDVMGRAFTVQPRED